ncbi:MAG: MarR family transcriptional regulator [Gammaproteobacteria bacterium]|nr:MarR family transcriptional regulator [Gammaproteobacteria bacterium]
MTNDVQEFVLLMRTVPRDWRAAIDRKLAPLGLSQAKWQPLLYLLRAEEAPTQADIARYLEVESPTVVRLLDRLEADGWIKRRNCPGDRRARRIHLTDRARAVCDDIENAVIDVRRQLLGSVTPQEMARCIDVLRRISAAAAELTSSDPGPVTMKGDPPG